MGDRQALEGHQADLLRAGRGAARGSVQEEYTLARRGAERLRELLAQDEAVTALGALSGNQAVQQVKAGLRAIYLSGWQVAADANLAGQTYPDQSLYPVNSVPQLVRRINNALLRADQVSWSESGDGDVHGDPYWLAPIVADAEAGFGGVLNAFELMKSMIAAGAAACTGKTSSPPRRSAATSAARCSSRPASTSVRSTRPGSRRTCAACRRWWWRAPTRMPLRCSPPT